MTHFNNSWPPIFFIKGVHLGCTLGNPFRVEISAWNSLISIIFPNDSFLAFTLCFRFIFIYNLEIKIIMLYFRWTIYGACEVGGYSIYFTIKMFSQCSIRANRCFYTLALWSSLDILIISPKIIKIQNYNQLKTNIALVYQY